MVSNGNEGYRARGAFDPTAPVAYPLNNWMNSGTKGVCLHPLLAPYTL